MRIVVLGYIIRGPLGGLAWHHLQYVLGLRQMGHTVLFLEDSDDYPSCYNPDTCTITTNPDYGLKFINDLFTAFDLQDQWSYFDAHTNRWYGLAESRAKAFCESADLVLNISGVNPLRSWCLKIPCRLLIDTDPVFTQIKHLTDPMQLQAASQHTQFASFGENFGKKNCTIPDDGFPWVPTRQPVYMKAWQQQEVNKNKNWTTVMQWDSYKVGEYGGKKYGMKSTSFQDYFHLPGVVSTDVFEIALGSASAPKTRLQTFGWKIVDPLSISKTPQDFQQYINASKGEWTVAKHGYVETSSGWFSERTLNYMASGKPVIVQDTGFSDFLPTGKGLLTFSSLDEAVEKIQKVNCDYSDHCLQARKIAEEFFDSTKVLAELLQTL